MAQKSFSGVSHWLIHTRGRTHHSTGRCAIKLRQPVNSDVRHLTMDKRMNYIKLLLIASLLSFIGTASAEMTGNELFA
jgi:hypothetical protein